MQWTVTKMPVVLSQVKALSACANMALKAMDQTVNVSVTLSYGNLYVNIFGHD